jgi:hypothetical protein
MKKQIPRGLPPLLLLALLLLIIGGCIKDANSQLTEEDKLPLATQEGKNTFGCLVDGKAWLPEGSGILDPGIQCSYNEIIGELQFSCQIYFKDKTHRQYLSIYLNDAKIPQEYILPIETSTFRDTTSRCGVGAIERYKNIAGQKIDLSRVDINTGIISGTFDFVAYSIECDDTLKITKGRFDVKYK